MTKNGLDIQTISTKRTDFRTDRFLLLGQVISDFNSIHLIIIHSSAAQTLHLVLPATQADPSQNQKSRFWPTHSETTFKFEIL
jgi:hypothetical protein